MPSLDELTLADIRTELRALLAHAETAERPQPTHHLPPKHAMGSGVEWVINYRSHDIYDHHRQWQVLTREPDDVAACVYVHTPDSMPGDYVSVPTTEARQIAMALLAACDRAEQNADGVVRLEDRRPA
jgi:hypothetical protein